MNHVTSKPIHNTPGFNNDLRDFAEIDGKNEIIKNQSHIISDFEKYKILYNELQNTPKAEQNHPFLKNEK